MSICKEIIKDFPVWKLTYFLAGTEKRLFELKKQGVKATSSVFKKLRYRRNILRDELLIKLQEWKKNPEGEEKITYSFAIEQNPKDLIQELPYD